MKNGKYILIVAPEGYPGKRYRGRYAYEHIVQFWRREGRMPADGCVVHHKNDDKHDNSFGNLAEITVARHSSEHSKSPIRHGTASGYRRGCRCEFCRDAKNASMQKWRKKILPL